MTTTEIPPALRTWAGRLQQRTYWIGKHNQLLLIATEMDSNHRKNAAHMIRRDARFIGMAVAISEVGGWEDPNEMSDGVYSAWSQRQSELESGERWIITTPLYKALMGIPE